MGMTVGGVYVRQGGVAVEELGHLAREILVVVDLVGARVELGLAGRAVVLAVDEAARRVVDHHVAAAREPGVVVVPLLASGVEAAPGRSLRLPARLVAGAAAVHEDDQRERPGAGRRVGDVGVERHLARRIRAWHRRGVGRLSRQAGESVAAVLCRHRYRADPAGVRHHAPGGAGHPVIAERVALGRGGVGGAAPGIGQRSRDRRRGGRSQEEARRGERRQGSH